jgi:phosphoenolpyruvate carboxylase
VPSQVILNVTQNYMVAAVNRLTLISSLEELFARVQVFGTELTLAKYRQKEWSSEHMDEVIAEMRRGLN